MATVRVLAADSMEGRRLGSAGGARARGYLLRRLAALGIAPLGAGHEQPFEVRDSVRGVNLLGIDSVLKPYPQRLQAWNRLATTLPLDKLEAMIVPAGLADLPALGAAILKGAVRGRVVVDVRT